MVYYQGVIMNVFQHTTDEVVSVSYWGILSIILRYPKYHTDLTNILLCKYWSSVYGALIIQDYRFAYNGKEMNQMLSNTISILLLPGGGVPEGGGVGKMINTYES